MASRGSEGVMRGHGRRAIAFCQLIAPGDIWNLCAYLMFGCGSEKVGRLAQTGRCSLTRRTPHKKAIRGCTAYLRYVVLQSPGLLSLLPC